MSCDVVIVGYRLNAKEPAPKALERILGLAPEHARKLARSFPAVVLDNAREAQAEQLMAELTAAGALVELRPRAAAPAAEPAGRRAPAADVFALDLDLASIPVPAPKRDPGLGAGLVLPELSDAGPALSPTTPRRPPTAQSGQAAHAHAHTALPASAQPASPKRPPPTPAAAPNYQLGDFGLARPGGQGLSGLLPISGGSVVAPLPTGPMSSAPPPASVAGGTLDLDLELAGGMPLELDQPELDLRGQGFAISSVPPANDTRGDRFGDAVTGSAPPPDVEQRAFRAVQRAARSPEVKRSLPPVPTRPKQAASPSWLREWVPSLVVLALLSGGSLAAVGYALDPNDITGALGREGQALSGGSSSAEAATDSDTLSGLHPLLRATPAAARAPLAAILRARIGGVHDVPVSFEQHGATVFCSLVEQAEGETEVRLTRLRETGREVAPPALIGAQLHEHERSLRAASKRYDLQFTAVCLTL